MNNHRWSRTAFWAVALVCVGLSVAGCSRADGKSTRIGFVSNNPDPFWTIAEAGTTKASSEFGVDVYFRRPPNGSAQEQKDMIEDLITLGVKGIAISVNDPDNQTDFLNRIVDRGVPVITQDNDAPKSKRLCYVGTDNYKAGKDAGKLVKEVMPQGGMVVIFVGKPDPLNARERRQGVLDELAGKKDEPVEPGRKYGNYFFFNVYYDYNDQKKAKDNVADVLTRLGDTPNVCMVGLWAYNPPAILSAVTDAGKLGKVKIVGFDEAENTLIGIKESHIHGTVVQQPYQFGYESVRILAALAKGDKSVIPANGIYYIKHEIIKQHNVKDFHEKLNQLLGKG